MLKLNEFFHPVDLLFAKKFLSEGGQEEFFFLAYLLKTARDGHLCIRLNEDKIIPSLHPEVDFLLAKGARKLPQAVFEEAFIKENDRIYLRRNWEVEKLFLFHWNRLENQVPEINFSEDVLHKALEKEALLPEQKGAILKCASQSLSLLLGGPGTGKTYTAKILIKNFLAFTKGKFAISAPTGKATANLREALKGFSERCTIQTLHSLLKKKLLSEDFILVDEASMIDAELMSRLFAGVKNGARLILLGDPDQLPPVESGNFFAEMAKKNNVAPLKTCLRAEIAEIMEMASNVKKGEMVPFRPLPKLQDLLKLIVEKENDNFRVLTPLKKGLYGVENLNAALCDIQKKRGKKRLPIMIRVNDPVQGLYNGDVGFFDQETKEAYFGEKKVPEYALPPYDLCYVHSIHKSQGSEYDEVLILLPEGGSVFGRELLYTAITRAKKKVEICAEKQALEKILSNPTFRLSGFSSYFAK